MQLKAGAGVAEEYRRRHDEVWPGVVAALKGAGVSDYSIFLEGATGRLFAVQALCEGHTADELPENPVVREWWAMMADLMETGEGDRPVEGELGEVFYME